MGLVEYPGYPSSIKLPRLPDGIQIKNLSVFWLHFTNRTQNGDPGLHPLFFNRSARGAFVGGTVRVTTMAFHWLSYIA